MGGIGKVFRFSAGFGKSVRSCFVSLGAKSNDVKGKETRSPSVAVVIRSGSFIRLTSNHLGNRRTFVGNLIRIGNGVVLTVGLSQILGSLSNGTASGL